MDLGFRETPIRVESCISGFRRFRRWRKDPCDFSPDRLNNSFVDGSATDWTVWSISNGGHGVRAWWFARVWFAVCVSAVCLLFPVRKAEAKRWPGLPRHHVGLGSFNRSGAQLRLGLYSQPCC